MCYNWPPVPGSISAVHRGRICHVHRGSSRVEAGGSVGTGPVSSYRIRSRMFTNLTDEDSDDMHSQFFHPPGNRLLARCYKKRVLLSFVPAIELATVNI